MQESEHNSYYYYLLLLLLYLKVSFFYFLEIQVFVVQTIFLNKIKITETSTQYLQSLFHVNTNYVRSMTE